MFGQCVPPFIGSAGRAYLVNAVAASRVPAGCHGLPARCFKGMQPARSAPFICGVQSLARYHRKKEPEFVGKRSSEESGKQPKMPTKSFCYNCMKCICNRNSSAFDTGLPLSLDN
ncbi:hypothetical protein NPIL_42931 [Nephila pilipes]|uniref:Uncharacterized protein n=1 Tax=Nephila pilipes TaxID=299642 RepID=A0A8X6NQ29_NEPPI|nr:hypothetical protein NPIL_42931 [Nephila pilipes]